MATQQAQVNPIVTELLKALELGVEMRKLQRYYFKNRDSITLRDALKAETAFDKQAKAVLDRIAVEATKGNFLP